MANKYDVDADLVVVVWAFVLACESFGGGDERLEVLFELKYSILLCKVELMGTKMGDEMLLMPIWFFDDDDADVEVFFCFSVWGVSGVRSVESKKLCLLMMLLWFSSLDLIDLLWFNTVFVEEKKT